MRHHTVLAHGLAVQAVRAMGRAGTKVGPAENMPHALPVIDSAEHVKAAETATRTLNRYFFADEMKIIGSPLDFVGINVYVPTLLVRASDRPPGYQEIPFNVSHPKMFSAWHRLAPESQYWSPRLLHSIWKPKENIHHRERLCGE